MLAKITNNFLCELPSLDEALRWFLSEKKDVSFESLWRAIADNPSCLVLYLAALAAAAALALGSLRLILPRRRWAPDRPWGAAEGLFAALLMFGLVYLIVPMILSEPARILFGIEDNDMRDHRIFNVVTPISVACGLVLLLICCSKIYGRAAFGALGFRASGVAPDLARGFSLALLTMPLMLFVFNIFALMFAIFGVPPQVQSPVVGIANETDTVYLVLACFTAIVCAAVGEETLFRGLFMQGFKRDLGRIAAILISAALFAVVHGVYTVMPAIFVLGIVLGYIYERTDGLWAPMAFHATFNAVNIAFLLLPRWA